MTNSELHDSIMLIRDRLIRGDYDEKHICDDLFGLMQSLRPELYAVNQIGFSYSPEFFHLSEFEFSPTSKRLRLRNVIPNDMVRDNILNLCRVILDPARRILGKPIYISSGYRSQILNKAVGGVPNSKHLCGLAADVSCYDNTLLFDILNNLPHSELIFHSPTYIHVAL